MAEAARTKEAVVKHFRTRAILEAARRVIGALGYGDASMERIAQEAGVAKGTLYLYFDSKEQLLDRAIDDGLEQLMEATRAAVEDAADPLGRLAAAVHSGVAHARDHRAFFQALIDAARARRRRDGELHVYTRFVADLVADGIRAGALRPVDPARAARMLVHVLSGLVAESLVRGAPFPADADVDETLDLFFRGLARPPGDAR